MTTFLLITLDSYYDLDICESLLAIKLHDDIIDQCPHESQSP